MLQAQGSIFLNGIWYTNPLININYGSSSKFFPPYVFAEIGEVVIATSHPCQKRFNSYGNILMTNYDLPNPSFQSIQNIVKTKLEKLYPSVRFSELKDL